MFASPLFWQIRYLVTNLNKKTFKSSVAELNQVGHTNNEALDLLNGRICLGCDDVYQARLVSLPMHFEAE
jgi:hypothetical protein